MISTVQFRRGRAAEWTAKNPVLASGEPGLETDTGKFKIGDGSSRWTALAYFSSGGTISLPIAESDVTNLVTDLAAKEILANKSTSTSLGTSDTLYPSQKAVKTYVDAQVTGVSGGYWPAFTAPINGDFAWINQGGASVAATSTQIYLLAPAGAGTNIRIRKKAKTAPYTITAGFIPQCFNVGNATVGIGFRESGSGKLVVTLLLQGFQDIQTVKYNSPTSFNGTPQTAPIVASNTLWFFRIADDNTDRIHSFSMDGTNFIELFRETRTTFITADEVLFFANAENAGSPAAMTLVSWKES